MGAIRLWDPQASTVERLPGALVVSREQPGLMALPHWHAQAEVNYVFRGSVEYQMAGHRVRLEAGALALFWGGLPHRVVDTGPDTYFHAVHLPLSQFFRLRLPPGLQGRLMRGATLVAAEPEAEDAPAFTRRGPWLASDDPRLVAHALDELLLRLERIALGAHRVLEAGGAPADALAEGAPGSQGIQRICGFIAETFREEIDAEAIALSAGLHPKYAMSLFKRCTGMTLNEYVGLMRVSYAQALLLEGNASILQVAMDSGFGSASAFNKCFLKTAGMTPSAFRQQRHASFRAPRP